jgi:pimeloyl-ACP methyl ester carboxylesterase
MAYAITRDGTELYYKDWGTGRPVVLIHGWPLSADSWDDQAKAIADAGMRAIAYDRRGFGRSDQPWTGYDYDTFADDLAVILEDSGATENVALVGFSMGGGEVARYMSRHGGRGVTQAALVGAVVPYLLKTPDNPDGVDQSVFDTMLSGLHSDRPAFFRQFLDGFFGRGLLSHPVSDEIVHWAWNMAMQAGLHPTVEAAKAFSSTDFRPDLPFFRVPTLIVHGTADKTVPIEPTARAAARAIPGSRLIEYEGQPHGLWATDKNRFTVDLLEFLAEGGRGAQGIMFPGDNETLTAGGMGKQGDRIV